MIPPKDPYNAVVNEVTAGPGGAERSAAQDAGGASIDKVRDILFGTQLREFDRRFARLEERMLKETSDLKEDLRSRLDALEMYARKEHESLTDQIKSEHEDRVEATKALERRTTTLDEQLSKAQRELRQQILEQHQRLSDDIRKRVEDLLAALARESRELRNDKADRTTLAALFNEMAMRLTSDLAAAGAEDAGNA